MQVEFKRVEIPHVLIGLIVEEWTACRRGHALQAILRKTRNGRWIVVVGGRRGVWGATVSYRRN